MAGELQYVAGECEKKLKRLKPDDDLGIRRITILNRVLERV